MFATAKTVRLIDKLTIEVYGIPSLQLMQNAAKAVLKHLEFVDGSICILCGSGNNAGDGFALAELLRKKGRTVSVFPLCGDSFSPDATYYYQQLSLPIVEELPIADIYVDAVFGTGFHGDLPKNVAEVFARVNQSQALRVAIDLPSGVYADSGLIAANAFRADVTVTFEILKFCHLYPICGKVYVEDIGLSKKAIAEAGVTADQLEKPILPPKRDFAHKTQNGTLFSVVGSRCYPGAACFSVNAALRSGCGMLTAFVPEDIYLSTSIKTNGAIMAPCPQNDDGTFAGATFELLSGQANLRHPTAILVGSGVGLGKDIGNLVKRILALGIPTVVDGDALRFLPEKVEHGTVIVTPHLGEFSRMTEKSLDEISENRLQLSLNFAKEKNVILVLKDFITVITLPSGEQYIWNQPNPGLAKGGSGDVLAGMIASFLAQGFSPAESVKCGVYYHAMAGKSALEQKGAYGMLPDDIIENIPNVLK